VGQIEGVPGEPFSDGGVWSYNYVTADEEGNYDATRFEDITRQLEAGVYSDWGVTNIMVYGPYASTQAWRGLPPTGDFMDFDEANGDLAAWREMVRAANVRGITVTVYLALLYLDTSNPLFIKAQEDRAAGIDSWQSRLLYWDPRKATDGRAPAGPPSPRQVRRPDQGSWAYSQVAEDWYATAWGLPALYYGNESTMEFAKRVLQFWMDNGVQGFEFDAPQSVWGFHDEDATSNGEQRHRELVTFPQRYRPEWQVYTMAEGLGTFTNADELDRLGYTHILLNEDTDEDSFVQQAIRGEITLDDLDQHFATYVDERREQGRGTYSPLLYVFDFEPGRLALDVAVQGGSGSIVSIDEQIHSNQLPADQMAEVHEVTAALSSSPAEAPAASRERLSTDPETGAYAIRRVSADGTRTAVNVFNLTGTPLSVTVTVPGTSEGEEFRSLGEDGMTTATVNGQISVDLPAWGWVFLESPSGQSAH